MLTEAERRRVNEADVMATGAGVGERFCESGAPGWAFALREVVALVRRQEEELGRALTALRTVHERVRSFGGRGFDIVHGGTFHRDTPENTADCPICAVLAQHPKEGQGDGDHA